MRRASRTIVLFVVVAGLGGAGLVAAEQPPGDPVAQAVREVLAADSIGELTAPPARDAAASGWGRLDRSLAWSYVALNALDAYQTAHPPAGVREANPLLASWAGERPSAGEVALFRAATTWGVLAVTKRCTRTPRTRRTVLVLINVIQLAAVAHNEQVSGGIVF